MRFKGKRVVVIVDETVKALGLEVVEGYAKQLYALIERLVTRHSAVAKLI